MSNEAGETRRADRRDHVREGSSGPQRVVILGAAGRDFHDFNVVYRDDPDTEVVAFTATQIPGIAGRRYPPELAGSRYPDGIPIVDESTLDALCRRERVDQVVFAYSDVSHAEVMHLASRVLAAGADFALLGPRRTMLRAPVPTIAVCASRTGAGKSQTSRWIADRLSARGLRAAVVRHPMPYGDLVASRVLRFAARADLDAASVTAEEREEFEPLIAAGHVAFEGVDYEAVLAAAAAEADLVVWDGGNNDYPFVEPDLLIAVVDPLRAADTSLYHPGESVVRMADLVVLSKTDAASSEQIRAAEDTVHELNREAPIVRAASPVRIEDAEAVRGRRVMVVEDGPTITHGGMGYGAGLVAATAARAAEIVDPRASAHPEIRAVLERWPHIGRVLPAIGYDAVQLDALRHTIESSHAEVVVSATPCDLAALLELSLPVVRVRYDYADTSEPTLGAFLDDFLTRLVPHGGEGGGG